MYSARPHAKSPSRSCPIPDPADELTSVLAHFIVVHVVDLLNYVIEALVIIILTCYSSQM